MTKKLFYTKYKGITSEMFLEDHNLTKGTKFNGSFMTCGFPSKTFLHLLGSNRKIDEALYSDKIPSNIKIAQPPEKSRSWSTGSICFTPDVAIIHLHLKKKGIPHRVLDKALKAIIIKSFRKQGLDGITNGKGGSDWFLNINGKLKKFGGMVNFNQGEYVFYALTISFRIDYDLMQKIYKLDTPKMKQKGNIKNINEILVGIDEVKVMDRDLFLDDFACLLSDRLGLELVKKNNT